MSVIELPDTGAFDFHIRSAAEFVEDFGTEGDAWKATLYPTKEAWLKGREGHIGASAAYMVLDTEKRKQLFDEMTGNKPHEDLSGNEFVQRGVGAEPLVRALLAVENPDYQFYDGGNLLFESKRKPFASASLDCIGVHKKTGEMVDIELKEAPWSNKWKGEYAPDGYFAQLMHQSFVTGIRHCVLHPRIYMRRDDAFTTAFERSYEYWMDDPAIAPQVADLMEKEEVFWNEVQSGRYRPVLSLPTIF